MNSTVVVAPCVDALPLRCLLNRRFKAGPCLLLATVAISKHVFSLSLSLFSLLHSPSVTLIFSLLSLLSLYLFLRRRLAQLEHPLAKAPEAQVTLPSLDPRHFFPRTNQSTPSNTHTPTHTPTHTYTHTHTYTYIHTHTHTYTQVPTKELKFLRPLYHEPRLTTVS